MEKRKLAKIPREEASDEMVRFAERAAGTHIVTTKDIEILEVVVMERYMMWNLKGMKGSSFL